MQHVTQRFYLDFEACYQLSDVEVLLWRHEDNEAEKQKISDWAAKLWIYSTEWNLISVTASYEINAVKPRNYDQ